MKRLHDILKERGMFVNDIRNRFKNNQIMVNGEPANPNDLFNDNNPIDIDDLVFQICSKNPIWGTTLQIVGIENIAGSNLKSGIVEFMNQFNIIRTSKKNVFVLKK